MTIFDSLGLDVARNIANRLIERLFAKKDVKAVAPPDFEKQLATRLTYVANTTARVEFFGLAQAKDTDRDTVDVFLSLPRKFSQRSGAKTVSEKSLLTGRRHYVLLGAPGAGKTTTLKRVARRLLLDSDDAQPDSLQYPILIRLRELTEEIDLLDKFGAILGLSPDDTWKRRADEPLEACNERRTYSVGAIADHTGALILLDGLDEVEPNIRRNVERDISRIAERVNTARIIVTCRSGDYNAQLQQFDALELAPLDSEQIARIARRWTRDYTRFLSLIAAQPFQDLTSRPLFLCQLLVVFEQTGTIPDQPSDVVERVVRLALEEWDERHKRQPRLSRYAAFDTARKRDFLANLAFWFTYEASRERFTTRVLETAYVDLHERFLLPRDEAILVARELETHTGIFVEVGQDFEFSHLSLQEFLTATYLVRQPISRAFEGYLVKKPAPLAVAVALSAAPEVWLAELLLRYNTVLTVGADTLRSFFARLLQERPAFVASAELGFVALALAATGRHKDDYVLQFMKLPQVARSFRMAGMYYRVIRYSDVLQLLLRTEAVALSPGMPTPPSPLFISVDEIAAMEAQGILRASELSA